MTAQPRRRWSCGEADWLTEEAHVRPRDVIGYPSRFTARDCVGLHAAGVTQEEALAAPTESTVDDLLARRTP